jgi:hypothetical protein
LESIYVRSEKCFAIGPSFEPQGSVVRSFFISPLSFRSRFPRCCFCSLRDVVLDMAEVKYIAEEKLSAWKFPLTRQKFTLIDYFD